MVILHVKVFRIVCIYLKYAYIKKNSLTDILTSIYSATALYNDVGFLKFTNGQTWASIQEVQE